MDINWNDPTSQVTEHFTVKECLYLHQWNRLANESDGLTDQIKSNLVTLCNKMEIIRAYLNSPINVHCMYRSPSYSILVGGSDTDPHVQGKAIDFDTNPSLTCDQVKSMLMPCLEGWQVRLEDNGTNAAWNHLDYCPVIYNRFFKS